MKIVECNVCGKKFAANKPEALAAHFSNYHPNTSQETIDRSLSNTSKLSKSKQSNKDTQNRKNNRGKKHQGTVSSTPQKVTLLGGRGRKVNENKICSECGRTKNPVWRYLNSDQGMVYLCQVCKPMVLERSKRKDAMDYRVPGDFFRG